MWVVESDFVRSGVIGYYAKNVETGERIKTADCELWASIFVNKLNEMEEKGGYDADD